MSNPIADCERSTRNLVDYTKQLERDKAQLQQRVKMLEEQNATLKREVDHFRNLPQSPNMDFSPQSPQSGRGSIRRAAAAAAPVASSSSPQSAAASGVSSPAPPPLSIPRMTRTCRVVVICSRSRGAVDISYSVMKTLERDFVKAALPHSDRFEMTAHFNHKDERQDLEHGTADAGCYVCETDASGNLADVVPDLVAKMQARTTFGLFFVVVVDRGGLPIVGMASNSTFVTHVKMTEREGWVDESKKFLSAVAAALARR